MLYYWVPEQFCAIEGVRKLPGGSWARFARTGACTWSTTGRSPTWPGRPRAAAAPDLGRVIEESVAAHLVADVPVSSFLSGGLDSSIVTVLAHRAAQEIDAYTITFRPEDQRLEAMPDDAVYARKVAAQFGVKLHEIEISPDIVDLLPRMVDALDEPIGDPAAINTLLMCEAARERGVKVILSGMGADELFGGYRKHLACVMASRYGRLPGLPRAGVRFAVDRVPVSVRRPRAALRPVGQALPDLRRTARGAAVPAQLHAVRPGRPGRAAEPGPARPGGPGHRRAPRHLHRQRRCTTRSTGCAWPTRGLFLPGLNLAYTDRASMAASVEVRVPFVDPVVAQAAFAIPGRDKIRNRQGKVALKRAAEEWLPQRDRLPAQGLLQRPAPRVGPQRPAGGHQRRARPR